MTPNQPAPHPTVQLVVARGKPLGKVIPVSSPRFTIGRAEDCQLRPHSELVSRRHAELSVTPKAVLIRDLGGRGRTLVNGRPITAPTPLRDGDRLQIGPLVFTVSVQGLPAEKATRPPSDADIASWLIADEESDLPERLADVYSGDTRVGETVPEPTALPQAAPAQPAPRSSSEAAYDLLKQMTVRRPGKP
jgi:predicted component of type VI protein secretion system